MGVGDNIYKAECQYSNWIGLPTQIQYCFGIVCRFRNRMPISLLNRPISFWNRVPIAFPSWSNTITKSDNDSVIESGQYRFEIVCLHRSRIGTAYRTALVRIRTDSETISVIVLTISYQFSEPIYAWIGTDSISLSACLLGTYLC